MQLLFCLSTFPPWNDIFSFSRTMSKFQTESGPSFKSSDVILRKMWGCIRTNNGIQVLLLLLRMKKSLVDADCIRALACKALCGLARSNEIRQVMGKLQIFNSGELQSKCFVQENQIFFLPLGSSCQFLPMMTWISSGKIRALLLTEFNRWSNNYFRSVFQVLVRFHLRNLISNFAQKLMSLRLDV